MRKKPSQLERDTAAYFENLSEEKARDKRELETALTASAVGIDIDAQD